MRLEASRLVEPDQVVAGDGGAFARYVEVVLAGTGDRERRSRAEREREVERGGEPPSVGGCPQIGDVASVVVAIVGDDVEHGPPDHLGL